MKPSLEEIAEYVCCPDDAGMLVPAAEGLHCSQCARLYPLLEQSILDLLPSKPFPISAENASRGYREGYILEYARPFQFRNEAKAWGAPEGVPRKWAQLRQREAREALQFAGEGLNHARSAFSDLSAGAGYCTFEAAHLYRLVFHCDLSVDSLAYAHAKAKQRGLSNIVFVRADYFQLPFRNSVHQIVCLDTLIRGPWHELRLLESVRKALKRGGAAVVDFHNWWHNPLRRMGVLRDNFSGNHSYTLTELRRLVKSSGIEQFKLRPFTQEVLPDRWIGKVISRVIPATRYMLRVRDGSSQVMEG